MKTNSLNKKKQQKARNRVKWWNLWGKGCREKQPAATVSSTSKQAMIIFSFCCPQKHCVAMNLIISPGISIYCCNAMQQCYKRGVISAFLWVRLILLTHSCRMQGLFLLKRDWVVSSFKAWHTVTWGFTSQFPEVESNNGEEAEERRLWLLRNITRNTASHSEPAAQNVGGCQGTLITLDKKSTISSNIQIKVMMLRGF